MKHTWTIALFLVFVVGAMTSHPFYDSEDGDSEDGESAYVLTQRRTPAPTALQVQSCLLQS